MFDWSFLFCFAVFWSFLWMSLFQFWRHIQAIVLTYSVINDPLHLYSSYLHLGVCLCLKQKFVLTSEEETAFFDDFSQWKAFLRQNEFVGFLQVEHKSFYTVFSRFFKQKYRYFKCLKCLIVKNGNKIRNKYGVLSKNDSVCHF